MFEQCCEKPNMKEYDIIHKPIPLELDEKMDNIIKSVLWYVPNIDSFQAPKLEIIENKIFEDFVFDYILNLLGMDKEKDVKLLNHNDVVDDTDWE